MRTLPNSALRISALMVGLASLSACPNDHVFLEIPQCATKVLKQDTPIELSKAADILIVVDNSGSMCEEQANLVQNFYDANCPITDLSNVPDEYRNPSAEQLVTLKQQCGFIQILAAYENDFRVGVITTDVGLCDNRYGVADDPALATHPSRCEGSNSEGWGRRPQRGCLQAPQGASKKFISRADEDDIGLRFTETLNNIQTFGSGFERGLDAVKIFLSPNATKHPDCEDDLDSFVREDASLVVIFLTDEDDCSHKVTDDFPDEELDDTCTGTITQQPNVTTEYCYTERDSLSPVDGYVDFLRTIKGPQREQDVRVAVIGGAVRDDEGEASVAGCRVVDGSPNGTCTESRGNSNDKRPGAFCNPDNLVNLDLEPCCEADPGTRYFQLANGLAPGQSFKDSICYQSFRDTMVEIAQFTARIEFIELKEPPANRAAIIVEIKRAGSDEFETMQRIGDDVTVTDENGWQLEGSSRIRFHGTAIPQPGDELSVSALANLETADESCTGEFDE